MSQRSKINMKDEFVCLFVCLLFSPHFDFYPSNLDLALQLSSVKYVLNSLLFWEQLVEWLTK